MNPLAVLVLSIAFTVIIITLWSLHNKSVRRRRYKDA
jgi:hypothetical protein